MTTYVKRKVAFGKGLTRLFCETCRELREVRATSNEYSSPKAWLSCNHVRHNELETR